jgi:hypothetical protein
MNVAGESMLHCRGLWLMLGVFMSMELLTAAFVAGTSFSAAAGNFAEGRAKLPARLDRPFVEPERIGRSLLRLMCAGPYFLVGEAIAARSEGRCDGVLLIAAVGIAALWCLASGILGLELLWQIAQHLGSLQI